MEGEGPTLTRLPNILIEISFSSIRDSFNSLHVFGLILLSWAPLSKRIFIFFVYFWSGENKPALVVCNNLESFLKT